MDQVSLWESGLLDYAAPLPLCQRLSALWPLQLVAERRNIFSWSREQRSTTPKRLVLIKLPLIPLAVLAPFPLPLTGEQGEGPASAEWGKNLNLTVHCVAKRNMRKATEWREQRDVTVLHKRAGKRNKEGKKDKKKTVKRQWQQVLWLWPIQGECTLQCDSELSCTIRLNTLVYRLDGDSSSEEWLALSLLHTHSYRPHSYNLILLGITPPKSRHEEKSPSQLLTWPLNTHFKVIVKAEHLLHTRLVYYLYVFSSYCKSCPVKCSQ